MNQFDGLLLSHIVYWLDGFDIAMLWFTGDRKIRYLISQGRAVTRFTTTFENYDHPLRVAYPRMVDCFFGLKTLELGIERFIDGYIAFSPSESLVSLILGDLNYSGFIELLKSTPTPFPNLKNLSMSGRTKEWEVDE